MDFNNYLGRIVGKKAQMTLFIILGIVAVVGVAITYMAFQPELDSGDDILGTITEADSETAPIQTYVHGCMHEILKKGVKTLCQNGGYINPLEHFSAGYESTESEMIISGANMMPYWNFFDETSGRFKTNAPFLKKEDGGDMSVESQLESYLEDNVVGCLNNFKSFRNEFKIKTSEPDAEVAINEQGVVASMNMPTEIRPHSRDRSLSLEDYGVSLEVPLQKLFRFAWDITAEEKISVFVERLVLELVTLYSGMDAPLPPIYEVTAFDPTEKFWVHHDVVQTIKNELLPYVNMLQIYGTENFFSPEESDEELSDMESIQDIASIRLVDPQVQDYSDLSVSFLYPGLKPKIQVANGDAMISPSSTKSMQDSNFLVKMMGAVMKVYKFGYDISFPLITKVCDNDAFYGEGLCLYLSLEANIRETDPFSSQSSAIRSSFGSAAGGNAAIDLNSALQRVNRQIEFRVYDAEEDSLISGAQIYYVCGKEFYVGKTEDVGGMVKFSGKLPYCASGGKIIVRKPGYYDHVIGWNNEEGPDVKMDDVELYPVKELEIKVMKKSWPEFNSSDSLSTSDLIILEIHKQKEKTGEPDFPYVPVYTFGDVGKSNSQTNSQFQQQVQMFEEEGQLDPEQSQSLDEVEDLIDSSGDSESGFVAENYIGLVPGTYTISIIYTINGNPAVHIPEEEREEGGFLGIGETTYTLPEINMQTWVVSQYEREITITDRMYDHDGLTIYVPDLGKPNSHNQLKKFNKRSDSIYDGDFGYSFH